MAGIYLHIPFCRQACHYCDFHFSTSLHHAPRLIKALKQELLLRRDYLGGATIETIYLGGGTPSWLPAQEIHDLLALIQTQFTCSDELEVTMEANPDDLNEAYLTALHTGGVHRLSIGVQTFQDELLIKLNRRHDAQGAKAALEAAGKVGFSSMSLDLMFGLPGQTMAHWQDDLSQALCFYPEHLSAYCLTVAAHTRFGHQQAMGKLDLPSERDITAQYNYLVATLASQGYAQYEVSNFCRQEHYARHNLSYWQGVPYLGVGPSAHSYDGKSRQHNVKHNGYYIAHLEQGRIPAQREVLTPRARLHEYLMTGLRTRWGIDLAFLKADYGYTLTTSQQQEIAAWEERGWLQKTAHKVVLTPQGRWLADELTVSLMP